MKVLVGIESCHHHQHYNVAQRETWIPTVDADVRFFIGGDSANLLPDEIHLVVPDDYKSLPHKTQGMVRYALENGYDYLFKCDTDTYVCGSRLLRSDFDRFDYVGRFRDPSGGYPAAYASGGPGYWLSAKSMEIIAKAEPPRDIAEDRWVANTLFGHDLLGFNDQRYKVLLPQEMVTYAPKRGNDTITCCEFPGKAMYDVHNVWNKSVGKMDALVERLKIR